MDVFVLALAAVLLAVERVSYVWIWHRPERFRAAVRAWGGASFDPIDALEWMFRGFKLIQLAVFLGWALWFDGGRLVLHGTQPIPCLVAVLLGTLGQALNLGVFLRIGRAGVFYGVRFGHAVPWCTKFPFSVVDHPQYIGTVLSIWGFFLLLRFPEPDWFVLPLLESFYYALGAHFESDECIRGRRTRHASELTVQVETDESVEPSTSP